MTETWFQSVQPSFVVAFSCDEGDHIIYANLKKEKFSLFLETALVQFPGYKGQLHGLDKLLQRVSVNFLRARESWKGAKNGFF